MFFLTRLPHAKRFFKFLTLTHLVSAGILHRPQFTERRSYYPGEGPFFMPQYYLVRGVSSILRATVPSSSFLHVFPFFLAHNMASFSPCRLHPFLSFLLPHGLAMSRPLSFNGCNVWLSLPPSSVSLSLTWSLCLFNLSSRSTHPIIFLCLHLVAYLP